MRQKLGIFILAGITVLAGTREAMQQFAGLKSSLTDITRASLWSGLIVYAQPVSDGKLPAPQIYYLMPSPQPLSSDPRATVLADNSSGATGGGGARPETKNNHVPEAVEASKVDVATELVAARRGAQDAAKSERVLDNLPLNVVASNFAPVLKAEKARAYEEVAKRERKDEMKAVRRLQQEADVIAKAFVKEFDAAKLETERARLEATREHLKSVGELANLHRQIEVRMVRRPVRPERLERTRGLNPVSRRREIAIPAMSSIGCEKTVNAVKDTIADAADAVTVSEAPADAAATAPAAAPAAPAVTNTSTMTMGLRMASEPLSIDLPVPAMTLTPSTSWALGCDTEPEQK